MNIELPQLLPECVEPAQQFCSTCRNREKGRGFREAILKIRGYDQQVHADFSCPIGRPWEDESLLMTNVNNLAKKECEFCEDIDLEEYILNIKDIQIKQECMKLDFDIEDYKSCRFEINKSLNGDHVLTQDSYSCLWSKKIDEAVVKFSSKTEGCTQDFFELIDVNIYLERIDNKRWWLSILANGGYELFSSVMTVKEGMCIGKVEFLNEYKEDDFSKASDLILRKHGIEDSIGTVIGHGGRAAFEVGNA